ncbi:MAG: D-alanine--D-alanine ligase [Bacteroidetes bacterium]|nr:D-alanine--D-alanine ligase [Bacteroidota bacterium]
MKKPNIALLTGGFSAEANISELSAKKVFEWIDKSKYNVWLIYITNDKWFYVDESNNEINVNKDDFSLTANNKKISFDLAVFFPLHGTPAEDGKLQGYLEMLSIPYTGCGVLASAITFDKQACKTFIKHTGVAMAKSIICYKKQLRTEQLNTIEKELRLPVFVKPNKNGSSYGVSKVLIKENISEALDKSFDFDNEVIVEEYIEGREFSCGVYQLNGKTTALPPTEIISQTGFFDYEAKYMGKSSEVTPANLSEEKTAEMQSWAVKIFNATGCRTLSRVDFILNNDTFYFLEVNTTPGMTNESLVPQQVRAAGMDVSVFINKLIEEQILQQKFD